MKNIKVKLRIKKAFSYILMILSGLLIGLLIYIKMNYKDVTFEQLIYSLMYVEGASINAIYEGIIFCVIFVIIFSMIFLIPWFIKSKTINYVNIIIKNKEYKIQIFPLKIKNILKYFSCIFLVCLIIFCNNVGIFDFLVAQFDRTKIFDDYYANPLDVEISFNENKKNLIYIFVESLEMANASIQNGGTNEISYIPNLEKLALNNINFSNTKKLGGAMQVNGTGWTIAAMVAQTSGVPLKLSIDGNSYSNFSSFMPGIYSLGEVLEKNGYSNYLMLGSDVSFGGRKDYFEIHGNYTLYDYNWAIEEQLIQEDYYEWWGYEDSKLFEYAKDKLTEISKDNKPFNFSLLTADTHFPNGYVDNSCDDNVFDSHYASSFYCSDSMISEFVNWLMGQDFYEDTVIVIVGDHLTMQSDFHSNIDPNYQRTVYNVIINSSIDSKYTQNRSFSTMDMYPTTLAAMGATINGERLGLGTNLFSGKKTLIEELGYEYLNEELTKKSKFYDKYILGDTYKEMLVVDKEK